MSENSKKHSVTIQTFSLIRRGITPPSSELTCTIEGDSKEEVRAKLERLYAEVVDGVDESPQK